MLLGEGKVLPNWVFSPKQKNDPRYRNRLRNRRLRSKEEFPEEEIQLFGLQPTKAKEPFQAPETAGLYVRSKNLLRPVLSLPQKALPETAARTGELQVQVCPYPLFEDQHQVPDQDFLLPRQQPVHGELPACVQKALGKALRRALLRELFEGALGERRHPNGQIHAGPDEESGSQWLGMGSTVRLLGGKALGFFFNFFEISNQKKEEIVEEIQ